MLLAGVGLCLTVVARYIYCLGLVANQRDRRMDFPNRRKPQMFPPDRGLVLRWHKFDGILYSDLCWVW